MPILNYTELLINIKTKYIYGIVFEEGSETVTSYIKLSRKSHICPKCGSAHTEEKGYCTRTISFGTEVSPSFTNCQKMGKYKQRRYRYNSYGKLSMKRILS